MKLILERHQLVIVTEDESDKMYLENVLGVRDSTHAGGRGNCIGPLPVRKSLIFQQDQWKYGIGLPRPEDQQCAFGKHDAERGYGCHMRHIKEQDEAHDLEMRTRRDDTAKAWRNNRGIEEPTG